MSSDKVPSEVGEFHLDIEPELPSQARRGPGVGRALVGWLVGLVFLAVVGSGVGYIATHMTSDVKPDVKPTDINSVTLDRGLGDLNSGSNPNKTDDPTRTSSGGNPTNSSGASKSGATQKASDAAKPSGSNAASAKGTTNPATDRIPTKKPDPGTGSNATAKPRVTKVLEGELTDDVTLRAGSVSALRGSVTVPRGTTLTITAGAELVAEPGSELVVHGKLLAAGMIASPAQIHGAESQPGTWKGIRVAGDFSEMHLRGTVVSDAESGVTLGGFPETDQIKFDIKDSLVTGNITGLNIENFSFLRLTNVAIVRNRDDGVSAREDDTVYVRVSIAGNGGHGIECLGKPAFQLDACSVIGNSKGGIHAATAGEAFNAKWTAVKCNLLSNSPYDVFCDQPNGVMMTGNYWGPDTTRLLKQLGDNPKRKARPKILDGLHSKQSKRGVVLASNFVTEFIESAGCDAAVLKMAGGEPLDLAKWNAAKKRRATGAAGKDEPQAPEVPPLFADIAEQLRELLPARQYDEVAALLDDSLADPDLKEVADLIRAAQEDVRLLKSFMQTARAKFDALRPGDRGSADGIRGEVSERRGDDLAIVADGVTHRSTFAKLKPSDFVFLLAEPKPPIDAALLTQLWLFHLADKHGVGADVDHWSQLATDAGADLKGRGIYLVPKGKAAKDEGK